MIFSSPEPLSAKSLQQIIEQFRKEKLSEEVFQETLDALLKKYESPEFSFAIYEIGGGYQFLSKPSYDPVLSAFVSLRSKSKLSKSMLESLSVIAYQQPTTRQEIERIRGVHAGYALERLLERELISIAGRSETPGQPLLYRITDRCLDFFGINSVKDLPRLEEHLADDTPRKSDDSSSISSRCSPSDAKRST